MVGRSRGGEGRMEAWSDYYYYSLECASKIILFSSTPKLGGSYEIRIFLHRANAHLKISLILVPTYVCFVFVRVPKLGKTCQCGKQVGTW